MGGGFDTFDQVHWRSTPSYTYLLVSASCLMLLDMSTRSNGQDCYWRPFPGLPRSLLIFWKLETYIRSSRTVQLVGHLVLQRGECHCYLIYLLICGVGSSRHPGQIQIRIVIWFSSYDSETPIVSPCLPIYCQENTHFHRHFHTAVHIPHNPKIWELIL
jgi:hypothetical protein